MIDPIVDEVRQARLRHTQKCNYNLKTIREDLKRIEIASGHKLVSLEPVRIMPTKKCTIQ
jgi:hypothetical protein